MKIRGSSQTNEERTKLYSELHALLDAISDNLNLISPDLRIVWTNAATARQLKKSPSEILGKYCYNLWHNRQEPCEICPVQRTLKTGNQESDTVTTPDGRIWDLRAFPIKDESGQIVNVIEVGRDITDQKKLAEQLRHAQKMEAIGTFAGGIAHDFNNMLNIIIGYGGLIQIKMKPDDPMMPLLNEILSAADKAAQLTRNLLCFSRKQATEVKVVNLNEIISNFGEMVSRIIGEDIELKINLTNDNLIIEADPIQIEQVLMNLATNARDAMPNGGALIIETQKIKIDEDFIKIHGYRENRIYALISVSDTGIGMDEKTRERIFEPYFTTKEHGRGTGLGLSMVYAIVKQHNGYINCYSEFGKGTTFKIYIPIASSRPENISEEQEIALKGGTETVLLAEDDESVRNLIKLVLENHGYTVVEAFDGEDAVRKFIKNKEKIKLLLSDVVMPKKSGKEVYEEVKKIKKDIKVLFISGYTREIMFKYDIDRDIKFLSKPIKTSDLLIKIREVLDTEN